MKFFTPQLYVEFNSDDPAIAGQADAQWEYAIADYRGRIQHLRAWLPAMVLDLAENVCLHDTDYLGYTITPVPRSSGETATVALQQHENVILLFYGLAEEPSLSPPYTADVFSEHHAQWLCDELDLVTEGVFSHEISLSNGRILSLRFVAFDMLTVDQRDFNKFAADRIAVG